MYVFWIAPRRYPTASSTGSTLERLKNAVCITLLVSFPRPLSRATRLASTV